jgi:hypothetical protein
MPTYLLHFSCRYRHAQHYLGLTDDIDRRLAEHLAGRGSPVAAQDSFPYDAYLDPLVSNVTRSWTPARHSRVGARFRLTRLC